MSVRGVGSPGKGAKDISASALTSGFQYNSEMGPIPTGKWQPLLRAENSPRFSAEDLPRPGDIYQLSIEGETWDAPDERYHYVCVDANKDSVTLVQSDLFGENQSSADVIIRSADWPQWRDNYRAKLVGHDPRKERLRPSQFEHPDPWMDNEPGTMTFPVEWNRRSAAEVKQMDEHWHRVNVGSAYADISFFKNYDEMDHYSPGLEEGFEGPFVKADDGNEPVAYIHWVGNEMAHGPEPLAHDTAGLFQYLRGLNMPLYANFTNPRLRAFFERVFRAGHWVDSEQMSKTSMAFQGHGDKYHISPRGARQSILEHGLDYNKKMPEFDQGYLAPDAGNYLGDVRGAMMAMNFMEQSDLDVWRVNVDGLTLIGDPQDTTWDDEPDAHWVYTTDPIGPERLTLIGEYDSAEDGSRAYNQLLPHRRSEGTARAGRWVEAALNVSVSEVPEGGMFVSWEGNANKWNGTYQWNKDGKVWNAYVTDSDGQKELAGSIMIDTYDPELGGSMWAQVDQVWVEPKYRGTHEVFLALTNVAQQYLAELEAKGYKIEDPSFENQKLKRLYDRYKQRQSWSWDDVAKVSMPIDNNTFYHVTDVSNLPSIAQRGLLPRAAEGTHPVWGEYPAEEDAVYLSTSVAWAESVYGKGAQAYQIREKIPHPVILRVTGIDLTNIAPDHESFDTWLESASEYHDEALDDETDSFFTSLIEQSPTLRAVINEHRIWYSGGSRQAIQVLRELRPETRVQLAKMVEQSLGDPIMFYGEIPPQHVEVAILQDYEAIADAFSDAWPHARETEEQEDAFQEALEAHLEELEGQYVHLDEFQEMMRDLEGDEYLDKEPEWTQYYQYKPLQDHVGRWAELVLY